MNVDMYCAHLFLFQVDLKHIDTEKYGLDKYEAVEEGINMLNFYPSQEWDILAVPARKTDKYYPCCAEPYPDITFNVTLRRKTLFYTMNLIIPCFSINMLTCLTFYLPSDSGEKISLCISILLSLSIFQILLMELIPATSMSIPLLGKYILFTMVLVSISVSVSVVTLSIRFRSIATHQMPELTRKIFLQIMPRILLMSKPQEEASFSWDYNTDFLDSPTDCTNPFTKTLDTVESGFENIYGNYGVQSTFIGASTSLQSTDMRTFCHACSQQQFKHLPPHMNKALHGVFFIAKHARDEDDSLRVRNDHFY